jgi:serine/threonine protein kinase
MDPRGFEELADGLLARVENYRNGNGWTIKRESTSELGSVHRSISIPSPVSDKNLISPVSTINIDQSTYFFNFEEKNYYKDQVCSDVNVIETLIKDGKLKEDETDKYRLTCDSLKNISIGVLLGKGSFNDVYSIIGQHDKVIRITNDFASSENFYKDKEIKGLFMQKYLSDLPGEGGEFICKIYEFGYLVDERRNRKRVYAILEKMEKDLFDLVHQRRLKAILKEYPFKIKSYFEQVLSGLSHMNKNGYVHLDIKNENVGIVKGKAKIFDFGSATYLENDEMPSLDQHVGTPEYEDIYFLDHKKIHKKFDIFSVGVMLAATYCFPKFNKKRELTNVGPRVHFDTNNFVIEAKFNDLITRMLVKIPTDRIGFEEALSHEWFVVPEPKSVESQVKPDNEKTKRSNPLVRVAKGIGNLLHLRGGKTLKKRKYTKRTKRNKRKIRSSK